MYYLIWRLDYKQPERKAGSSYQRKGYELPDYLKDKVTYNQLGTKGRPIIKSSQEDRSLSYNRKLHKAIYQRNNLVSSSRSPSRKVSNGGGALVGLRKKVGLADLGPSASQPNLPPKRFIMDVNQSRYVQALNSKNGNQPQDTKPYETPEPLRLLKKNLPGAL